MADWADSVITIDTDYRVILGLINARVIDAAQLFSGTPQNPKVGFVRLVRQAGGTFKLQEYNGSTWADRVLSSDGGGTGETSGIPAPVSGIPTGAQIAFAGSAAPAGWLECDGRAVSRTAYRALFTAIGITHGNGDGSTTFNLPDCRGRTIIGSGQGSGLTNRARASKGGEESHVNTVQEMPVHTHTGSTGTAGSHSHKIDVSSGSGSGSRSVRGRPDDVGDLYTDSAGSHTHSMNLNNTGGGQAHNNMQPFLAEMIIIKT